MYAIIIDAENYIKDISDTVRKPGSILVNSIPDEEDPEKMQCYQYIKEKYVFDAEKWATIEARRAETAHIAGITQEINALKAEIAASDYQIIKCYEYALNGLPAPYDVAALHEERQAKRDRINDLEATL